MRFEALLDGHGPALWRVIASYASPGAERFLRHLRTLPLGQRQVLALALLAPAEPGAAHPGSVRLWLSDYLTASASSTCAA